MNYINKRVRELVQLEKEYIDSPASKIEGFKHNFYHVYKMDETFNKMNAESIKTMFRMNMKWRFIPFHQFGIFIEY